MTPEIASGTALLIRRLVRLRHPPQSRIARKASHRHPVLQQLLSFSFVILRSSCLELLPLLRVVGICIGYLPCRALEATSRNCFYANLVRSDQMRS